MIRAYAALGLSYPNQPQQTQQPQQQQPQPTQQQTPVRPLLQSTGKQLSYYVPS